MATKKYTILKDPHTFSVKDAKVGGTVEVEDDLADTYLAIGLIGPLETKKSEAK